MSELPARAASGTSEMALQLTTHNVQRTSFVSRSERTVPRRWEHCGCAQDVIVLSSEQTPLCAASNHLLHVVQHVTVAKLSCWSTHTMMGGSGSVISLSPRKHNHTTASEKGYTSKSRLVAIKAA